MRNVMPMGARSSSDCSSDSTGKSICAFVLLVLSDRTPRRICWRPIRTTSPRRRPVQSSSMSARRALEPAGCLRSEEHTSELQSRGHLVCRLLLEKKKKKERRKKKDKKKKNVEKKNM